MDNIRVDMIKSTCKMVYKGFYDLGPTAVNDLFILYAPKRELRSGDDLQVVIHKCNTAFGQKNMIYRGCQYWNKPPVAIKASGSPQALKKAIKEYQGFG